MFWSNCHSRTKTCNRKWPNKTTLGSCTLFDSGVGSIENPDVQETKLLVQHLPFVCGHGHHETRMEMPIAESKD